MIMEGAQRGGAIQLARHLLNERDNDHIEVHELNGFVATDLTGALKEAEAVSMGTQCRQQFFSVSFSPPETENVPVETFEEAIRRVEKKMGLSGQPRAVIFHEKKGRRHAHCVWSRIDVAQMKAINLPHFKLKLTELARQIYLDNEWQMPPGFENYKDCDPQNYSRIEACQSRRVKRDPKALKKMFQECWATSDSQAAFAHALKEHGFILAHGDRRGHVAVDAQGEVYAISRWVGVRVNRVRARLGEFDDLPSVDQALEQFTNNITDNAADENQPSPSALNTNIAEQLAALDQKRLSLVKGHRQARLDLKATQQERRVAETLARNRRLPTGLKSAWSKLSGHYQTIVAQNEEATARCESRDRAEQQSLIERQLRKLRLLKHEADQLRGQQSLSVARTIETSGIHISVLSNAPDAAARLLKTDPTQQLIIPVDPETLSIGARVRKDPTHILNVITDKKENFSRPDILRALSDHIDDPLKLRSAIDKVMRSNELVEIQSDPLPRYSTWEIQNLKATIASRVGNLVKTNHSQIKPRHIHAAITTQNKILKKSVGAKLSDQQEDAIRHVLDSHQLSVVVGLAGTGKSTMLTAAKDAWTKQGYRVIGATLSGKAADSLQETSGIASRTLASLEHSWKSGFSLLQRGDVLVIDEAGMVGLRQMARFVGEVQNRGARLVLVGDPEQLQPINAGTPFRDITEQIDHAKLTEIRRQKVAWQRQATLDLAQGRTEQAINAYADHGAVHISDARPNAIAHLVQDYMADVESRGSDASRLAFTHRRKDVFAINQAIRMGRKSGGDLADEQLFRTDHGPRAFAPGDRIMFTKNDTELGVKNGLLGTVENVGNNHMTVRLDTGGNRKSRSVTLSPKRYSYFDHGYAATIHKGQGATADNTFILSSPTMDRHLTYVALSRHREAMKLYGDPDSLKKMRRSRKEETQDATQQRHRRRRHGLTMG